MIGYPYGQFPAPSRIPSDGFGYPYGRCRLIALPALPFGPRLFRRVWRPRTFPRVRLRFNFGEPGFGALPPPAAAPVAQQMVYDGLGNPLGIFPFFPAIAALAAKVLPIAAQALPLISKVLPMAGKVLPGLLPGGIPLPGPAPGAPAPPTVASPIVRIVTPGPLPMPPPPPPCLPPTMEECRRLYPIPPPAMPFPGAPIRRRRPRIVRIRQR
jgi:hypothetical protein